MDIATIITTVSSVIKTISDLSPGIIKTIEDAKPFAETIVNTVLKGKQATQADLDALEAQITSLSQQLQAPLPPDDGTTTT